MATLVAEAIRHDDRYPVRLRVDCTSREDFTAGYATNLSRSGLFIASEQPLPADSALELTLTLADSIRIRALGRVVWNRDAGEGPASPGMGVKFLSLSCADWGRLVEFLAGLPAPAVTVPAMRLPSPALTALV